MNHLLDAGVGPYPPTGEGVSFFSDGTCADLLPVEKYGDIVGIVELCDYARA